MRVIAQENHDLEIKRNKNGNVSTDESLIDVEDSNDESELFYDTEDGLDDKCNYKSCNSSVNGTSNNVSNVQTTTLEKQQLKVIENKINGFRLVSLKEKQKQAYAFYFSYTLTHSHTCVLLVKLKLFV